MEMRNSKETGDLTHLQKGADFVRAFLLGFDVDDAVALLRLDELFLESFEIEDGMHTCTTPTACAWQPLTHCLFSEAIEGRQPVAGHRSDRRQGWTHQVHH